MATLVTFMVVVGAEEGTDYDTIIDAAKEVINRDDYEPSSVTELDDEPS